MIGQPYYITCLMKYIPGAAYSEDYCAIGLANSNSDKLEVRFYTPMNRITVTGTESPSSVNTRVIPALRPTTPIVMAAYLSSA